NNGVSMARNYEPEKIPACTKGYWERPPDQHKGDATQEAILQAVGEALTAWETMEEEVGIMFVALVGGSMSSASPIRRAFGVVNSSSTRRQMILAAAEAYFGGSWDDKNVRVSFSRVLEAISWASRRRDDIAHGIAKRITLDQKPFGWFLFPA